MEKYPYVLQTLQSKDYIFQRCLGVALVQSARFVHNVVLPFAVPRIP
jgi:hypothetical protein